MKTPTWINVLAAILTALLFIALAVVCGCAYCGIVYLICTGIGWPFSYKLAIGTLLLLIELCIVYKVLK